MRRHVVTRYPAAYRPTAVALLRELRQVTIGLVVLAVTFGALTVAGIQNSVSLVIGCAVLACITSLGSGWVHRTEARDLARREETDARIRETDVQIREALARTRGPRDQR